MRNLFLIDADIQNNPISNSAHIGELFGLLKTKQFTVKRLLFSHDNINNLLQLINQEQNIFFIIHSFKKWGQDFNTLVNNANSSLVVCPTDLSPSDEENKIFTNSNIDKIIVGTDYYHKYFTKNVKVQSNKLKVIYSSSPDKFKGSTNHGRKGRILVTPSLISPHKDFITLLKAVRKMRYNKYINNLLYIILLKKHPDYSIQESNTILDEIQGYIESKSMTNYVRVVLSNDEDTYKQHLQIADIILLPYDNSSGMYSGIALDAIVAGKPIVAPDILKYSIDEPREPNKIIDLKKCYEGNKYLEIGKQRHIYDLTKREAGIFLYQNNDFESIITSCATIFDNKEIKDILQEQSKMIVNEFTHSFAAAQLLTLLKRLK